MEEVVAVARVPDELEAEVVCGLLRSAGIECGHRMTEELDSMLDGFIGDGPHEVIVHPDDLEAARAVLAEPPASVEETAEQ